MDVVMLQTADQVTLPAGFFPAAGAGTAIDAIVINGGTGTNFWFPTYVKLATLLQEAGYPALTMSTRGRDVVIRDQRNNRYLGAAYERISDCVLDFNAAIRWMADRGFQRVALFGQSLGATKASYYAAHDPDPALAALINNAGPRWSASQYDASDWGDDFRRTKAEAEAMVAEGRGETLFEIRFPIGPTLMTADSWLDKYGAENYNLATWAQNIRVPALRIDCSEDVGMMALNMVGMAEDLLRLAPNPQNRALVIDADHFFTKPGSVERCAEAMLDWLGGLKAEAVEGRLTTA